MAIYSLSFKPTVEKDLLRIPRAIASKILTRIDQLPINPFPPINQYNNPENPLNPINEYNPATPFQPLNHSR